MNAYIQSEWPTAGAIDDDLLMEPTMQDKSPEVRVRHLGIAVSDSQPIDPTRAGGIVRGIYEEAIARQYHAIVHPMPLAGAAAEGAVARMVEMHRDGRIEGFIVDEEQFQAASIGSLRDQGVPVVIVNGSPPTDSLTDPVPTVAFDDRSGVRAGVEHLVRQGHRCIAMIVRPFFRYPPECAPRRVRQQILGYRDALTAANIKGDDADADALLLDGDPCEKSRTYEAVDVLLANRIAVPTAIIVGDDVMALMVLRALQKRGMSVPGDMSLVSYGGWTPAVSQLAEPELTSVHTPLAESGKLAARMIIELIESGKLSEPCVVLQPELIIRGSTAPPQA